MPRELGSVSPVNRRIMFSEKTRSACLVKQAKLWDLLPFDEDNWGKIYDTYKIEALLIKVESLLKIER